MQGVAVEHRKTCPLGLLHYLSQSACGQDGAQGTVAVDETFLLRVTERRRHADFFGRRPEANTTAFAPAHSPRCRFQPTLRPPCSSGSGLCRKRQRSPQWIPVVWIGWRGRTTRAVRSRCVSSVARGHPPCTVELVFYIPIWLVAIGSGGAIGARLVGAGLTAGLQSGRLLAQCISAVRDGGRRPIGSVRHGLEFAGLMRAQDWRGRRLVQVLACARGTWALEPCNFACLLHVAVREKSFEQEFLWLFSCR